MRKSDYLKRSGRFSAFLLALFLTGTFGFAAFADSVFPEEIPEKDPSAFTSLGSFRVSQDFRTTEAAQNAESLWDEILPEENAYEAPEDSAEYADTPEGRITYTDEMFRASDSEPAFLFQEPPADTFSDIEILQNSYSSLARVSAASPDIYSFVHISDTQYSTALAPYVFQDQCQFIVREKESLNIRFVAHTGDIIDCAPLENQWLNAKSAVNILENAEIPRQIIAGNHDIGTEQDYRDFLAWFGADTYINNYTSMYSYNNGEALVELADAGNGHIWMFVGTGWNPSDSALQWAASVMSQHAQYPTVVMTHDYLDADGTVSSIGRRIASYLVDPFPNTRIVLCGHNHAYATNVSSYDDNRDGIIDRRVYAMLADYQADGDQETGKFRILTVSETEGLIYVRTYSTQTGGFVGDDAFVIKMDGDWFAGQDSEGNW